MKCQLALLLLALPLLCAVVEAAVVTNFIHGNVERDFNRAPHINENDEIDKKRITEFRGVWLTTVKNLDWPMSPRDSVTKQRNDLLHYVETFSQLRANAFIFQVRSMGDAVYSSNLDPWSAFLTDKQGRPPSPLWDPLQTLIEHAHAKGQEVHAWLNPYRANVRPTVHDLAPQHMAKRFPQFAYIYGENVWMDPGANVVEDHIVEVVKDIINRYNVDGIHFDDYFYPYPVKENNSTLNFPDDKTYEAYKEAGGRLERADWRRSNTNRMIKRVFDATRSTGKKIKFGISPSPFYKPGLPGGQPPPLQGSDSYSWVKQQMGRPFHHLFRTLYANTKKWFQLGWCDYLAPQLYWPISRPATSYRGLLDWWLGVNSKLRHIYAGNAVYRILPPTFWPLSELKNQITLSRNIDRRKKKSLGNILFRARYYVENSRGVFDFFRKEVYAQNVTIPTMNWL